MGYQLKKLDSVYLIAVIAAVIIAAMVLLWPKAAASGTGFGKCLSEKGWKMYGSDTCASCQRQKAELADDFKDVNYINCLFNAEVCKKNNISKYPTWINGNDKIVGVQTKEALSEYSSCKL